METPKLIEDKHKFKILLKDQKELFIHLATKRESVQNLAELLGYRDEDKEGKVER